MWTPGNTLKLPNTTVGSHNVTIKRGVSTSFVGAEAPSKSYSNPVLPLPDQEVGEWYRKNKINIQQTNWEQVQEANPLDIIPPSSNSASSSASNSTSVSNSNSVSNSSSSSASSSASASASASASHSPSLSTSPSYSGSISISTSVSLSPSTSDSVSNSATNSPSVPPSFSPSL